MQNYIVQKSQIQQKQNLLGNGIILLLCYIYRTMRFIDAHCHLDRLPPNILLADALLRAEKAGVKKFVVPAVSGSIEMPGQFTDSPDVHLAWGIHPCFAGEASPAPFSEQISECGYTAVAIGECGLDRRSDIPLEYQLSLFRQQLELARKMGLPVIVHLVGFQQACFELLEACQPLPTVIMHSWSGSAEMALRFAKIGCCISFSASILRKGNVFKRIITSTNTEKILVETDTPDMLLPDWHLKHNEPAALPVLVESLADIAQVNVAELAEILYTNAARIFML